jgi:hypothetical protein
MGRNRRPYMNEDAIERTAKVVKAFEGGGRDQPPIRFRQPGGDDGDPVRLGKTTAAWAKGTLADIELYEEGTPPSETANSPTETLEDCVNKFADGRRGQVGHRRPGRKRLLVSDLGGVLQ